MPILHLPQQLRSAGFCAGEGARQLRSRQGSKPEQEHPGGIEPRIPPQFVKTLAKGRRRARHPGDLAQRLVERLEQQFHRIVAVGFGIAIGAEQAAPDKTREGQGVRRKAEQRGLGDGEQIDRPTGENAVADSGSASTTADRRRPRTIVSRRSAGSAGRFGLIATSRTRARSSAPASTMRAVAAASAARGRIAVWRTQKMVSADKIGYISIISCNINILHRMLCE